MTTTGAWSASMIMRARVLLALDTSVGQVDAKEVIAARLEFSGETLRLVAKRFAETGGDVHATITRKRWVADAEILLARYPSKVFCASCVGRGMVEACSSQSPKVLPAGNAARFVNGSRILTPFRHLNVDPLLVG